MKIAGIGFSTTDKSIRRSWSHSDLDPTVSNVVSSASIVDFVKIVCLQDSRKQRHLQAACGIKLISIRNLVGITVAF
jgi:hypothetical protein